MNKPIFNDNFSQLLTRPKWLLAFDRDGTLVPYASKSEDAILSLILATKLIKLSQELNTYVTVISARGLKQLRLDLDRSAVVLAGNYGMEIELTDGKQIVQPQAVASKLRVQEAKSRLLSLLDGRAEVLVDNHNLSVCVHFQHAAAQDLDNLHQAFAQVAQEFSDLRIRKLPTSYEILPALNWDKGLALAAIESALRLTIDDTFYLYIGDTEADEAGYRFVNQRQGLSVNVGQSRNTDAKVCLNDSAEVEQVIDFLLEQRARRA
jgi:trehalose-phosphatase